jgi:hypothetical protein
VHDLDRFERPIRLLAGTEFARQRLGLGEIEIRERGR